MHKIKWVFCGGMYRSGSTLQYNIASKIIELLNFGKRERWLAVENHRDYFCKPRESMVRTFKSHILSPEIREILKQAEGVAIASFRDVRDVVASQQTKRREKFTPVRCTKAARSAIRNFCDWEELPCEQRYISKYECFVGNIGNEICNIAKAIGCEVTYNQVASIERELDPETVKKRLAMLEEKDFSYGKGFKFETTTNFHIDHFNGGVVGRYRYELGADCIDALNSEFGDWLLSKGYSVTNFATLTE